MTNIAYIAIQHTLLMWLMKTHVPEYKIKATSGITVKTNYVFNKINGETVK